MPPTKHQMNNQETTARAAIKQAFGTPADKSGATLFVSHHLEEIEAAYWEAQLGTAQPEPARVLDILVLRSHWRDDDGVDTFDFTLPGGVTDYMICVRFDDNGRVREVSMES